MRTRPRDVAIAAVVALLANAVGLWLLLRVHAVTRDAAILPLPSPAGAVFRVASSTPPPEVVRPLPRPRPRPSPTRALPAPKLAATVAPTRIALPDFDPLSWMNDLAARDSEFDFTVAILSEDIVDEKPRVIRRRQPAYPVTAEAAGIEGSVVLLIVVDADGKVVSAEVDSAEPEDVFDDAALRAAREWRFSPATHRGRKVACRVRTQINFTIDGGTR